MATLKTLISTTATSGNALDALRLFLLEEEKFEKARLTDKMQFVGYVLELGYQTAKIITSDPYKIAVGGIPRGSFLVMTPKANGSVPLHFTLLRVSGVVPTPLSSQVQQTYFELHKRSMPELDIWTESELQWGALECDVLGMFYAEPKDSTKLAFSGDVNNVVSAHLYKVFTPDDALLKVIVNGMLKPELRAAIGSLRTMECGLTTSGRSSDIPVQISMKDFKGFRTAMFGKTRLGKSNVVKLIVSGMIEATKVEKTVGQLIFDINGEYANDNPQDGNKSIRSAHAPQCEVYSLTPRPTTPSKPLRLNFYEQPDSCLAVLSSLLQQDSRTSIYIQGFASVPMPNIEEVKALPQAERDRPIRKIQIYWAILKKAGFADDLTRLQGLRLSGRNASGVNPHFNAPLRTAVYQHASINPVPAPPTTLSELVRELEHLSRFAQDRPNDPLLISPSSGDPLLDPHDIALLKFLAPPAGSAGPVLLAPYAAKYHSPRATDFITEILTLLDEGKTVILDLGNATDETRRYFSDLLSRNLFSHQESKFVNNTLGDHYIQIYFEEAHNLFPPESKDLTGVYARFAKEGAKFHIGILYSTQSPSTINKELLAQTENFFIGHLSSQDETRALSRVQVAFSGSEEDILRAKTPGFMRMLTVSHRFVIPVQANLFQA